MPADTPRLLHRHSQYGYTDHPGKALHHEPEAVDAGVQQQITDAVRRSEREQLRGEWLKTRQRVLGAVEHFEQVTSPSTHLRLRSDLRVIARTVERVDRQLGVSA